MSKITRLCSDADDDEDEDEDDDNDDDVLGMLARLATGNIIA